LRIGFDGGIDEFVLSGIPHLEEAYWFGEGVLPILRAKGLWRHPRADLMASAPAQVPFAAAASTPRLKEPAHGDA